MKNKKNKRIEVVTKMIVALINSQSFKERSRMSESDFTRNRKLSFPDFILFMLSASKMSLQAGLRKFLKAIKEFDKTYTKQAFSKGRNRIKPEAYKELMYATAKKFYDYGEYETYKGYRVMAVDGSKYNLPDSSELLEAYGMQKYTNQIQALGSCLYDVCNGIVLDAVFAPHNANEKALAVRHLEVLAKNKTAKDLILFDRGYPSSKLMDIIDKQGFKYIMRCSTEFLQSIRIKGNDCIVEHTFNTGITAKIRILKIEIEDNCFEYLATNIYDDELTLDDFKELYHMRWGIEEKYKDFKIKLEIENFSGISDIAVRQDYYITAFLSNLAHIIIDDNKEAIKKYNEEHDNKYQYKQNVSQTISDLKLNLVDLLREPSNVKRGRMLMRMKNYLQKILIPIREDRHYERKKKHKSSRFSNNRRPL